MIAVIADDLTGAAEIAGIALGYGLSISLHMGPGNAKADADIIIVSTDARSKPLDQAIEVTTRSLYWLKGLHPEFIFKKTDSLMRGHVREELRIQQTITGLESVLLIPANPSLGRTIKGGQYLIYATPLAETAFRWDPEYPATSSMVTEILGSPDAVSAALTSDISEAGIIIGDVTSSDDMRSWVKRLTPDIIPAGGGDYFSSILSGRFSVVDMRVVMPRLPIIFVKGSAYGDDGHPIRQSAASQGLDMLIDPAMIDDGPDRHKEWVRQSVEILTNKGRLFIGFDHQLFGSAPDPVAMRDGMAAYIDAFCAVSMPAELFIEGGSTAQTILDKMNINSCRPSGIWSRGVVRLDTIRLAVTVKPGSYPIPESLIRLFT